MKTDTTAPEALDPAEICALPPDDLAERLAWIRAEILPHSIETVRLERGVAFELSPAPGLAAKLDRLIELERECCSGIDFERVASAAPEGLRLEIRGIDPDARVFRPLGVPDAAAPAGARIAKAAGLGALGSLFVCCVLPIGAVAPLASLDGPGPIAAGALIGGSASWLWLGQRRTRGRGVASPPPGTCGPGC